MKTDTTCDEVSVKVPKAVNARQLADVLGLSVRTVRRLDSSGKLPRPLRIGGAVRGSLE